MEKAILRDPCLSTLKHIDVLAADELSLIKQNGAYVINTDPRRKPGQHWIAVYANENGIVEVFDPLGYPPDHYPYMKDYWRRNKNFTFNAKRWQPPGTSTCGQFCLFYLFHKCRSWTLNDMSGFYWTVNLMELNNLVLKFVANYLCVPCRCKTGKYQRACSCV